MTSSDSTLGAATASADAATVTRIPAGGAGSDATSGNLTRTAADLPIVRLFVASLLVLLAGYMFMGRGFAHLGLPPIYLGEVVLALGLLASGFAIVRLGIRARRSAIVGLVLLFMAWGVARTVPYLGTYGADSLRDAILWGYAFFALFIFLLADRTWVSRALRAYGLILPVFALWLPIAWNIFLVLGRDISNQTPGAIIPIVYFKAGDMAVHAVGAVAFLVLFSGVATRLRTFAWRYVVAQPLAWTMFICGTISRGALVAVAAGLGLALLATRRFANWLPVALAAVLLIVFLVTGPAIGSAIGSVLPATGGPATPGASEPPPWWASNRPPTVETLLGNAGSVLTGEGDANQQGTARFRLQWWSAIVKYTVFGPYFWAGKGFGVNLADDDGFQPTQDHSLRAPHNSSMTVLARMGVPGFVIWVAILGTWAFGLLRAFFRARRANDRWLSAAAAWILIYWVAIMIDTSFDPYLEGPQGGIWFWSILGLGLVVIRLAPVPGTPASVPLLGERGWRRSLRVLIGREAEGQDPDPAGATAAVPSVS